MAEVLVQVVPRETTTDGYLAPPTPVGPESFSKRAADIADGVALVANSVYADLEAKLEEQKKATGFALDAIELKFSLDLEAEAGVVIARAKTTAGFEATLSWKRRT